MEAIRRKIKRNGNKIVVEIPDSFKAENLELIILPDTEEESTLKSSVKKSLSEEALEYYKNIQVDLSRFKFNRDELHER